MDVERPEWFDRAAEWWNPVVGDAMARHVQPVGVSSGGRLYVLSSNVAWSINMRLLAPRVAARLRDERPEGIPEFTGISVMKPPPVPDQVIQQWADLVGADLADEVRPESLMDWGRELVTEAASANARDLLARRAPVVLARLRAALPDSSIVRLSEARLRPVWVLIASSPEFSDRAALENVLMDVWHDATQTVGPEHKLCLVHAGETAADQMVEEWATAVREADPSAPLRVDTLVCAAGMDKDAPDASRRRDEWLVDEPSDLCVVFAVREDEELPLAELAREGGTSVWRHVQ
jgi:predicted nucleic acid-binding Zn ribbon protein